MAGFGIAAERLSPARRVITVEGEVDLFAAPELKELLAGAIADGVREIVVDLMQATFVDSSSLGVLIAAHSELQAGGGMLSVACDVPAVVKALSTTGLDGLFAVLGTREAALAALPDAA